MTSNGHPSGRMREFLRNNILGLIAIFIAMSGTAYAVQANSIRSQHIVDGQVARVDLANNAVNSSKVVDESLGNADISSLDTSSICTGCLSGEDINDRSLRGIDIDKESIGWPELGPDSVGDSEIANNEVKGAHIVESTLNPLKGHLSVKNDLCYINVETVYEVCGTLNFETKQQRKPALVMITYQAVGRLACNVVVDGSVVAQPFNVSNGSEVGGVPFIGLFDLSPGTHNIVFECRTTGTEGATRELRIMALELGFDN